MNESIILIMAAGQSCRFGSDKRQARFSDDQTLLMATLARVMACGVSWRLVLREDDDPSALMGEAFAHEHASRIWRAPQAVNGLGASLGDAFRQLAEEGALKSIKAATVWLADMPDIMPATLHALLAQADEEHVVRPMLEGDAGKPGHPVVFGRRLWAELAALEGGEGAREVIAGHRESLREVTVDDTGIHRDVDTPAMLTAIQSVVSSP